MTVHIGILLALVCAVATNLGFLYKHRGACEAMSELAPDNPARVWSTIEAAVRGRGTTS